MLPLSARDLLRIWEWGEERPAVDKALAMLAAAYPDRTEEELAMLSVGQRDTRLMALRELTFGPQLDAFTECPQCQERLEFTLSVSGLRGADVAESAVEVFQLTLEGFEVHARLPNSLDLAAIVPEEVSAARDRLLGRCVLQARRGGEEIAPEALPEIVRAALAAEMAAREPCAEIQLDLHCPACGHHWPQLLDIVSFFWAEISAQAKRLLVDIHTLARAYGWREQDILAMSARRRQSYLEMVT